MNKPIPSTGREAPSHWYFTRNEGVRGSSPRVGSNSHRRAVCGPNLPSVPFGAPGTKNKGSASVSERGANARNSR